MMKKQHFLMALCLCLYSILWSGCIKESEQDNNWVEGMRPVYISADEAHHIYSSSPQNIVSLGKIYTKQPYLFVNDSGIGVHVVDNSNPSAPQRIAFIHIPGNRDIAIKGNYLYADNLADLVTIDISDLQNISVVNRVSNLYSVPETSYPLGYSGYFECADIKKGVPVSWEKAQLLSPKCRR